MTPPESRGGAIGDHDDASHFPRISRGRSDRNRSIKNFREYLRLMLAADKKHRSYPGFDARGLGRAIGGGRSKPSTLSARMD
jgi:hypothetical protein